MVDSSRLNSDTGGYQGSGRDVIGEGESDLVHGDGALKLGGATGSERYAELDAAQARLLGIQQQASRLCERCGPLASQLAGGSPNPWDRTESIRKILEGLPFDLAAGDQQIEFLAEPADSLEKWAGEGNESIKGIEQFLGEGNGAVEELIEGAYTFERMGSHPGAWSMFMRSLTEIKGAGCTMTGLGVIADIGTVISPQDGVIGNLIPGKTPAGPYPIGIRILRSNELQGAIDLRLNCWRLVRTFAAGLNDP